MISVREVIYLAAKELGREDLCVEMDEEEEYGDEIASLIRCFSMVENEIALDYFPLKKTETLEVTDRAIEYEQFERSPVYIYGVRSEAGAELPYELHVGKLVLPTDVARAVVSYSYSPTKKTQIDEESEFELRITPRLMSYGVACEFCLCMGKFQEAALWESKYKDALRAANLLRRPLRVRSRRWV